MKFRIIIRLITDLLIVFLLILMVFGFGYSLMEVKSVVKLSYRQNLKTTNPEKYEEYLIKQKERNKAYRRKLKSIQSKKFKTPEEKDKLEKYRTSACLRQQKFRKKLQLDGDIRPTKKNDNENQLVQPTKKKVNTRLEIKQQRESWRLSKSLWRSKLSGAKKRWIKEKDKQRKRKKRIEDRIDDQKLCTPPQSVSKLNQRTLYNVASTVRKKLPKSPDKFAEVLHHIEKTLTPNKKQALTTLRGSDDKSREILFKIKLRLKKRSINIKRKQRKDTLSITTKKKVNDFYFNNSRPLPNKRYATKYGPGFVFQLTLRNGYTQFRKENPKLAICFSKFASLRPKNVRLLSKSDWQYCVCTVCQNIRYKLQTLNSLSNLKINSDLYLYDIIDVFLCSKPGTKKYHKHECVYGKCSKCNNYKKTIEAFYKDLLSNNDTQSRNPVTWHHWERVVEKDEKIRKNLLTKSGTLKEMLDEFFVDLSRPVQGSSFFKHHFQGNWQQSQFLTLKSNLPEDTALLVLDFGKNRNIHHQDQAKSDFFAAKQVTIHPIVVFYKSRTIPELTVRESIIFVTDDLKHDVDAVQLFLNEALRHVKSIGEVRKVVIFSDGCTAQYKGSRALEALSRRKDMIEWNFFGSDHGKSEADGEMGNLNRALDLAVIGRQVIIRNSADIVDWGNKNLKLDEAGSKRHFKYISTDMISGIRDENQDKIITIKGIRNYHQVRNLQKDNEILVRSLSCYCKKCCGDLLNSECLNADYVEEFTKKIISKSTKDPSPESSEAASYNFNKYFKTFNDFSDYNSLKEFVDYNCSHVPVLPEGNTDPTFLSTKKRVDRNSISLIPEDLEDKGLFPAVIYGDGNCLPRCGSVLAYGFEDKFNEMRQRIVMDLVLNEQEYLKNDNSKTYSMFSEFYRGQKLTKLGIQDIYRTETLDVCKNGSFMGVWQLMALANILKRPIHSVYPSYGGKTVQKDLNKIFYPLTQSTVPPAYILWTNTEGDDISEKNWMPNHFVVLLRTHCDVLSPHHDLDSSTSGFDMSDIEELVDSEVEELAKDIPAEENIQMRSDGYSDGQYVLVRHGTSNYPAVVVDWPWVFFYKPLEDGLWIEVETRYTVLVTDIIKEIPAPCIEVKGHRLYYKFEGMARTAQVKRDARIGEAEARKESGIKEAIAEEKRMAARYANDIDIAKAQRDFHLKKAAYDQEVETKKASAEMAYELQAAKTKQKIREEQMQVMVVERTQQIQVQDQEIVRRERELEAQVRKPAEAEKYRMEKIAEANKARIIMEAQAEAEAVQLKGEAEAFAIEAKAKAEAEQMAKKADAWKDYQDAAMVDMVLETLPKVAAEISGPLTNCKKVTMVSSGKGDVGALKLTNEVMGIMEKLPSVVENLTGINIQKTMKISSRH